MAMKDKIKRAIKNPSKILWRYCAILNKYYKIYIEHDWLCSASVEK
jgi:hypothetical protein